MTTLTTDDEDLFQSDDEDRGAEVIHDEMHRRYELLCLGWREELSCQVGRDDTRLLGISIGNCDGKQTSPVIGTGKGFGASWEEYLIERNCDWPELYTCSRVG